MTISINHNSQMRARSSEVYTHKTIGVFPLNTVHCLDKESHAILEVGSICISGRIKGHAYLFCPENN
jgi:hypothetical protein